MAVWSFGAATSKRDPRRRAERQRCDVVRCDLGELIDLSGNGLRFIRRKRPGLRAGQVAQATLSFEEGHLRIPLRIVWAKRRGLFGQEIGAQFVNPSPGVVRAIESLARFGFVAGMSGKKKRPGAAGAPPPPDLYAVLGVRPDAGTDRIRQAYRDLARRHHPDVTDDPEAQARFIVICEAYQVLIDPVRRAEHDLSRAAAPAA